MAKRFLTTTIICALALLGSGCGGSGTGATAPPSTPQPPPPNPAPLTERLTMIHPTQVETGESISLIATVASGAEIAVSHWQQLAGPAVALLANKSQVVSFDVTQAGEYQFSYTASDTTGDSAEQLVSISAISSTNTEYANVRLDHAVTEQGKVSLRVDVTSAATLTSINWRQISGPTISSANLSTSGQFLFFDAPAVAKDELLAFEATLAMSNGSTLSDVAYVLVKNTAINSSGYFPDAAARIVTEDVYPYLNTGSYRDALVPCLYNNLMAESCSFAQLPVLGSEGGIPSVEQVMQRVVVSHDWMGERFRQYLQTSPVSEDIRRLLNAATGIVIAADVRPSFYWIATGGIYLDPANFWTTAEERDTLNDAPDYRSDFGRDLQFIVPWRYVQAGRDYLNRSDYPQQLRLQRSQADVQADITWLLFHELAHANDFLPPHRHPTLSAGDSPLSFFMDNAPQSQLLETALPLYSQELKDLAQVSFTGTTANAVQRSYDAADFASFFEPDNAVTYYSYLNSREDYATIFERFMMAYRLGVSADVAVLSAQNNPQRQVTWGQRDRINLPQLRERTVFIVNSIYPELAVAEILDNLPQPQNMTPGVSWFDNLMTNAIQTRAFKGVSDKGASNKSASNSATANSVFSNAHLSQRRYPQAPPIPSARQN